MRETTWRANSPMRQMDGVRLRSAPRGVPDWRSRRPMNRTGQPGPGQLRQARQRLSRHRDRPVFGWTELSFFFLPSPTTTERAACARPGQRKCAAESSPAGTTRLNNLIAPAHSAFAPRESCCRCQSSCHRDSPNATCLHSSSKVRPAPCVWCNHPQATARRRSAYPRCSAC
jgi:hypothetical protein